MTEIETFLIEIEQLGGEFVFEGLKIARAKLDKEASGNGCGCSNCLHKVVDEWNTWLDMLQGDDEHIEEYRAYIDWRLAKPSVVFGHDPNPPYCPQA